MIIQVDKEAEQVIRTLCDISLKKEGISAINDVIYVLQTMQPIKDEVVTEK